MEFEQTPRAAALNRPSAEKMLVLALASSAGIHGALVPAHAAEAPVAGAMFALSALLLGAITVHVARAAGAVALGAAALVLAALIAAYVATRFVALPPLTHSEPVDLLGVTTKLIEASGLVLALRLLGTRAGSAGALPALHEGAG